MLKLVKAFGSFVLVAVLFVPATAQAQDQRLRVSLGAAAMAGGPESEAALTASVGYRFAERLSFDVDMTAFEGGGDGPIAVPMGVLEGRFATGVAGTGPGVLGGGQRPGGVVGAIGSARNLIYPPIEVDRDGHTVLATLGFRYTLASQVDRFSPYVTAGIGISRSEQSFSFSGIPVLGLPTLPGQPTASLPASRATRQDVEVTHTGLASSAGVGASVRIVRQLSADVDARYFRLDGGRNIGRIGGGVSYKF